MEGITIQTLGAPPPNCSFLSPGWKGSSTGWLDQWEAGLDEVRKPTNQGPALLSLQWPDFSGRWKDRLRPRLRHQSSGLKLRIVAMTGEGLRLDKKYNNWQKVPESIPPSPHAWKMLPSIHKFAVQDNAYFLAPLAMVGAKPGRTLYWWHLVKCLEKPPLLWGRQRPALHPLQSNPDFGNFLLLQNPVL